jgi:hypothetical protein
MKRGFWFTVLLIAALGWWQGGFRGELPEVLLPVEPASAFSPGLSLHSAPIQRDLAWPHGPLSMGEFQLTPMADFQIEARVLGRRDYRTGVEARLSPMDLALGWGRMADPEVLSSIQISQSGRFYRWRVEQFPIPRSEIERSSANMHLIPADAEVARALRTIARDDQVRLAGYLVNVDRDDGWRWRTSLTRDDTGHGACEIVLVTRVQIL